jgi:hypothetical protein
MYDVYGEESFIPSQITWLQNDLQNAGDKTKVLFYHFDFKGEINLTTLGVDMALWGHIHSNSGNINIYPYNLSTDNVCDDTRAYRVIRYNNNNLQPENSIYTHSDGDMLSLDFNTINNGSLDSVSATLNNKHNQSFNNGLIKFEMPLSDYGYSITNGSLEQIIIEESIAICYVKVEILSNNDVDVSIKKNLMDNPTQVESLNTKSLIKYYPNPFTEEIFMKYEIQQKSNVNISVYNLSGQLIKVLTDEQKDSGEYVVNWDATNTSGIMVGSGIYFYKFTMNDKLVDSQQLVFIK